MKHSDIKTKSENIESLFRYILKNGSATKQDLHTSLGLSLPTIKQGLDTLHENHFITSGETVKNTGGRNAIAYQIDTSYYYAIGIFISLNHLSAVCLDLSGNIISSKRIVYPLDLQNDDYLKKLGEITNNVISNINLEGKKILGVGIAIPSLISDDGENTIFGMTTDFTNITRKVLSKYIPYHTTIFHDSDAAAIAEIWKNPELNNAIYINLNASIGSSIIIDGKPYKGSNHLAGEIGHIIVAPGNGKQCYCGQEGCFDTVCNTNVLDSYTNGDLNEFFHLIDKGDEYALTLWNTYLDYLALTIRNLKMMFDCNFIIGGNVGARIEKYMPALYQKIDKLSVFVKFSETYVYPCSYKKATTAVGAAIQILENHIKSF